MAIFLALQGLCNRHVRCDRLQSFWQAKKKYKDAGYVLTGTAEGVEVDTNGEKFPKRNDFVVSNSRLSFHS